jgi:hypothetical protein
MPADESTATASGLRALTAEAFIYGFPLVFNLGQVDRFVREGMGAMPAADWNRFAHARALAGPQDTFVSINNDTVYSVAALDLSGGPLRLEVPDAADRYYVLQFVDAWTNNFAYVGQRATGTAAGAFWIVAPGFEGDLPDEAAVIHAPTMVAMIVGRWAVDGEDDLPAVHHLQDAMRLTPLHEGVALRGLAEPDPAVEEDLRFLEQLRVWAQAFPPAIADQADAGRYAPLGLGQGASPYTQVADERRAALRDGLAAGRERLEQMITESDSPKQNGWEVNYHVFDYNDDFFELGALDDPRWRIADRRRARATRAAAARGGLWGNHAYEAAYVAIWVDAEGEPLTGERSYTIRFEQTPPVGAFWSITMYDVPEFFLVANPVDRYSIGDRTPGLRRDDDGALTLVLQRDDPGGDERANWLPTPPGAFRPLLRMYGPRPEVFDGSFELPPIVRRD